MIDLAAGWTDEKIFRAIRAADKVGIDCPFGWPEEFVGAVSAHSGREPWPGRDNSVSGVDAFRRSLRYRATDEFVKERSGVTPLSVSTDRIGITAMRCARLLDQLAVERVPIDRDGGGKVVEVYPAAREGWIHLPRAGSLTQLAADISSPT